MEAFDASRYVRPGLTLEQVEEIKEAFDLIDTDGSGKIDPRELTNSLKGMGY